MSVHKHTPTVIAQKHMQADTKVLLLQTKNRDNPHKIQTEITEMHDYNISR